MDKQSISLALLAEVRKLQQHDPQLTFEQAYTLVKAENDMQWDIDRTNHIHKVVNEVLTRLFEENCFTGNGPRAEA